MNGPSPESPALLDPVVAFYGSYLSCSPEQLDLLALWTLHSYCFQAAPFSPALNIRSRQEQSGKSLCLVLLDMLCYRSWLHIAPPSTLLLRQLQRPDPEDPFVGTLLLDDCRIPARLQGIFAASFNWHGNQIVASKDGRGGFAIDRERAFFPKAFAASGCLPASLADLAIPIDLEPKKPGSPCRRFCYLESFELAVPLTKNLYRWTVSNSRILDKMSYTENQFPPQLSSRQQDCAEPLLHLADLLGGEWPQRARRALVSAFALSAFPDFHASRQLLSGLRDAFSANGRPAWISTAGLLNFLHNLGDYTWDASSKGGPLSPRDLARILEPFGIRSHNHRTGTTSVAKGYRLRDFEKSWELHLPRLCGPAAPGRGGSDVAAPSAEPAHSRHQPWSAATLGCESRGIGPESPNPESPNPQLINPESLSGKAANPLSSDVAEQSARPAHSRRKPWSVAAPGESSDATVESEDRHLVGPPGGKCNPQTAELRCGGPVLTDG